jgi:hypothetical protein
VPEGPIVDVELFRGDQLVRLLRLDAVLRFGRHLDNDVVLTEPDVSGHHAVLGRVGAQVVVSDLRSRNGTSVNGRPVDVNHVLRDRDLVRLGAVAGFRVRVAAQASLAAPPLALLDEAGGAMVLLTSDRASIGSAADATLRLPTGPPRAASIEIDPTGEVWVDVGEGPERVGVGDPVVVGGRTFRVVAWGGAPKETWTERERTRYPVRLLISLNRGGGPVARVQHDDGPTCEVVAENRVVLLYALARQRLSDLAAGAADDDAGWVEEDEVIVAVWGRTGLAQTGNNLSVLVHRLRRELEAKGLDPAFLERRRRHLRLRLDDLTLA